MKEEINNRMKDYCEKRFKFGTAITHDKMLDFIVDEKQKVAKEIFDFVIDKSQLSWETIDDLQPLIKKYKYNQLT